MARARVRLRDIAEATGFSMNTVSLALRASPRIGERTRALILEEAGRQGYFPNRVARSLASRASGMVGLIMTDIMNPTLTLAARTIERKLRAAGYGMMFAASDSLIDNERKALESFQSYQVDGILIYPANRADIEHIKAIRRAGLPVLLLANLPASGLDIVAIDDRAGAQAVVRHLLERGHRRIAMLDGGHQTRSHDKLDGARQAIQESGLPSETLIHLRPTGNGAHHGFAQMQRIHELTPRATALFASTDSLAIGALRWCRANGIAVPKDLAIAGYDNTEASEFSVIPLTTVNYAADKVSNLAVDRIIAMIDDQDAPKTPLVQIIEPELMVRETS